MADEDAVANDGSSSGGPDAGDDTRLPAAAFGEPVDWSDAIEWPGSAGGADAPAARSEPGPVPVAFDAGPLLHHMPPGPAAGDAAGPELEPLPESIWGPAADGPGRAGDLAFLAPASDESPWGPGSGPGEEPDQSIWGPEPAPATVAEPIWEPEAEPDPSLWAPRPAAARAVPAAVGPATAFYAEAERHGPRRPGGRFHVRHAPAAVIGVVALLSVVLVGFALSARNRADVTSTASPAPAAAGNILAQGLTVPTAPATTTTVVAPPPSTDAVPATDPAPAPAPDPAPDTGAGAPPRAASTGTTTPARSASAPAPSATQPPSTPAPTPAPAPTTASTQPPVTSPPVTDTTAPPTTTRPRPSIPDITIPSIPDVSASVPATTVTTRRR